jgi:L-malate glycosyltransferase
VNVKKDKIKILYVIDHFDTPSGGTEGQLYNLITNLDEDIFESELCLYRYINNYFLENEFPIPVMNIGITSFRRPETYHKLLKLRDHIKKNDYDIVQIIFNDAALSVPLVTAGLRAKIVATRRDMGFWYTPLKLNILRQFAPLTDAYLVNSHTVKQNIMEKEKVPEKKIEVIYNAHKIERFYVDAKVDFLSQNDIPAGSRLVGIVSNFRPVKRVSDLIKAFPPVLEAIKNAYLIIIGDPGVYEQEYTYLINKLGIKEHVKVLGSLDIENIVSYIKWFDIGVMCSESEGLSNAIIEYMGCGVPVLATDVPSNRELLDDESGILYPVGNLDVLSGAIIRILKDKEIGNRVKRHTIDRIKARFDEATIIQKYQDFYMRLANDIL